MFHAPSSKHRWNSIERLVKKRFPWSDLIVLDKKGPGIANLQLKELQERLGATQPALTLEQELALTGASTADLALLIADDDPAARRAGKHQ